ncbi:hypothetical protein FRC04_006008 [Tulasnella sp. 424]|nr:hypothetical protein FRC04_006008 [Tulasnella sp. 424]KAG8975599.1 hypothetical protein FRC05_005392 [Tulasnella sp. 425]
MEQPLVQINGIPSEGDGPTKAGVATTSNLQPLPKNTALQIRTTDLRSLQPIRPIPVVLGQDETNSILLAAAQILSTQQFGCFGLSGGQLSSMPSPPLYRVSEWIRRGRQSSFHSMGQSLIVESFSSSGSSSPGTMSSSETLLWTPSTPSRSAQNTPTTPFRSVGQGRSRAGSDASQPRASDETGDSEPIKEPDALKQDVPLGTDGEPPNDSDDHRGYTIPFPAQAADRLLFFTDAQEAESILATLVSDTRSGTVDPSWITSLGFCPPLLHGLFRLADEVTSPTAVLNPRSQCARIIDLLLERFPAQHILSASYNPDGHAAAGMRYLIRKGRAAPRPNGQWSRPPAHGGAIATEPVINYAFQIINRLGVVSVPSVHAIRLVESVLPGVHTLGELQCQAIQDVMCVVVDFLQNDDPVDENILELHLACCTASLQLVASLLRTYKSLVERVEADSGAPMVPEEGWLVRDFNMSQVFGYVQKDRGDPLVRCMGLQVLRCFADVVPEAVSEWKQLSELMELCSEVILWRTKWQHGLDTRAKSLDIVRFCPHDDAYRIMSFAPPSSIIDALSKALSTGDKGASLEPLLSMIVDHSTLKDHYWPFMLSMLIRSGCFAFFLEILKTPLDDEYILCRTACRAKADACIGMTRCFEQMRAKDTDMIPPDTGTTLASVAVDTRFPVNLCECASEALRALIK